MLESSNLVVKKGLTQRNGIIAVNITSEIRAYLRTNKIGRIAIQAQCYADNTTQLLPDVSFTRDLDRPVTESGAVPYMPDLAVEIKSPDDTYKEMREKARYYLSKGTQLVWLVFPEKQIIEAYTLNDEQIFDINDTLSDSDVLPNFSLSVSQVFAD